MAKRRRSNGTYTANKKRRSAMVPYRRPRSKKNPALRNIRTGGLLSVERKYFDTFLTASALVAPADASGGELNPATILCLNGVPSGDGATNRDGMEISMQQLEIKGIVNIPVASVIAGDAAPTVLLSVVLDTQTNATDINSEDVYTNPGASALASSPLRKMENRKRFRVLKQWRRQLTQPMITYDGTDLEQSGVQVPFHFFIPLNGLKTQFKTGSTTGYYDTIIDNKICMLGFTSSTTYAPTVSYNARLRFVG